MKSIKQVIRSQKVNMGGILLEQPLPIGKIEQVDPFLLIHHWDQDLPGGQSQSQVGVGPHPHRGFAPVTFIFDGSLHHRDSEGYDSVVHAGGTQWMNSGRGIIHSERPTEELAAQGGKFEIIQFWINAPAKHKMDAPHYQPLHNEDTPVVMSADQKIKIGVVAGKLDGAISPIDTYSDVLILRMDIEAGGETVIPIPATHNTLLYVLDGQININGDQIVQEKEMVIFNTGDKNIVIKGIENARAIILSGEPIGEPMMSHGPFVMNNEEELLEAIRDYQKGKMGRLVEQF